MIFTCEFEIVESDGLFAAIPFGLDGATQGRSFEDALEMAAEWLYIEAADHLMKGKAFPKLALGNTACHGGQVVLVATRVNLGDIPAVPAAEAARMLGVSTARVAQLCSAGDMYNWKLGGTRMVALESIEERLKVQPGAGRPKAVLT